MNTASQNYLDDMVKMQHQNVEHYEYPADADSVLHFDEDTISSLEKLNQDSLRLSKALDEYLDSLQETFVNSLLKQLADNNVNLQNRLHLHLSAEGQMVVEGDENDADKVCHIISQKPAMQRRFKNLSYLAMLSHGVDVARQACQAIHDDDDMTNPLFGHYHMYIKGALSHFCIRE